MGCAAHSLLGGVRFENPRSLEAYLSGERALNRTVLSADEAREETLMLATRLCEGLSCSAWREMFGEDFRSGREAALASLERGGFIECGADRLRLTEKGMEVQDAVVMALLESE